MRTLCIGLTFAASLSSLSGCIFHNVGAEETLRDTILGYNEETRWNRLDLASQRVAPPYRGQFRATHYQWHERMQIADSEVLHVQIGEDRAEATSTVSVRWYDQRTMLLAETVLIQKWKRVGRSYVLVEERVGHGDGRLMALPDPAADDDPQPPEAAAAKSSKASLQSLD